MPTDDVLFAALNAHVSRSISTRREAAQATVARDRIKFRAEAQAVPIFRPTVLERIVPGAFDRRIRRTLAAA